MITDMLKDTRVILGSQSPRRRELLTKMGVDFEVIVKDVLEDYNPSDAPEQIVEGIALKKLRAFNSPEFEDALIITADTIVVHAGRVLGKPSNATAAFHMLRLLQGCCHDVFTAVAFSYAGVTHQFMEKTTVEFVPLTDTEISFYIENYKPYDKAGSYGIQEWIGLVAVKGIEGSYENVIGLPTARLYQELKTIFFK